MPPAAPFLVQSADFLFYLCFWGVFRCYFNSFRSRIRTDTRKDTTIAAAVSATPAKAIPAGVISISGTLFRDSRANLKANIRSI